MISAAEQIKETHIAWQKPVWSAGFDAPINHVLPTSDGAAFLCGDGYVHHVDKDGVRGSSKLHSGAILSAVILPDGRLLTGGDDGRACLSNDSGHTDVVSAHDGIWVDCVAASSSGAIVWSAARRVYHRDAKGVVKSIDCPTTPASLAFDPKGRRVAIALYGGVWLWLPKDRDNLVRKLDWKGSHVHVTWSPDGKHVLTSMQENEIHGWRLSDAAHLRMPGYPAKIHSFSWHRSGQLLATGGGPTAVIWPFDKEGPWNRRPAELGYAEANLARVAWHPHVDVIAGGCALGSLQIATAHRPDGMEIKGPGDGSVTGLCWINAGAALAAGTATGRASIFALESASLHVA